jgi:hypothetical protein
VSRGRCRANRARRRSRWPRLVPAGEGGAEITRCVQLLSDLCQRALVGTDVLGQATLRRVAAEQRCCAALRSQLLALVMANRAGVGQVVDPHFFLLAQTPRALAGLS